MDGIEIQHPDDVKVPPGFRFCVNVTIYHIDFAV
jgi:hypothetical protein